MPKYLYNWHIKHIIYVHIFHSITFIFLNKNVGTINSPLIKEHSQTFAEHD